MNPLTQVKNTQKITAREHAIGITEEGSWHAKYKDSAYVYVGGLPFDLTEGDVLAVFAQYGEIVDVNLVRDKATGKSKGFAFLAYEDQRSTVLAVDNLNGARVVGRIIKVDHVGDYKKKLEEDEEEKQRKREERGVCYAFQRGECNRGADCKFSHDEERNANTGWGGGGAGRGDGGASWKHDQFDGSMKEATRRMNMSSTKRNDNGSGERDEKPRGVCYAFQRGECNRGDGCKFAHDEQESDLTKGFLTENTNTGRGGGDSGWKHDQFDGSTREAGRRMNTTNTVSTKRKENDVGETEEIPQRRDVDRWDRQREDGYRKRDNNREDRGRDDLRRRRGGDREDRGRDDVQRRRDGDRENQGRDDLRRGRDGDQDNRGRDDVQRRRDGDREDQGQDQDRKESDRRVWRDDYREGGYDRKDPRDNGSGRREERRESKRNDWRGRDDDERDRNRDSRKDGERSDRGDDGSGERIVRSRR